MKKKGLREQFIDILTNLVMSEIERHNEQQIGLTRRDGGRKMNIVVHANSLLAQQKTLLTAEIEKMMLGEPEDQNYSEFYHTLGFNNALTDVLKKIQEI